MKKAFVFSIMFLCLSVVLAAQSSNDAQRIVGTWVNEIGGARVVFNANGTMSGRILSLDPTKFVVVGEKIVLMGNISGYGEYTSVFDFRISNDGKTLLLFTYNYDGVLLKRQ